MLKREQHDGEEDEDGGEDADDYQKILCVHHSDETAPDLAFCQHYM